MSNRNITIEITGCRDPRRWYAGREGHRFNLTRVVHGPLEYQTTTLSGSINFIQPEDCTLVERLSSGELVYLNSDLEPLAAQPTLSDPSPFNPQDSLTALEPTPSAPRPGEWVRVDTLSGDLQAKGPEIQVKLAKGVLLRKSTAGSAGYDIEALEGGTIFAHGGKLKIPTGVSLALPKNMVGKVYARSGLSAKADITLANSVGVIDSDYRGEIIVVLRNIGTDRYEVKKGDRVAQLVIEELPKFHFKMVDKLPRTDRGANNFGSTGK